MPLLLFLPLFFAPRTKAETNAPIELRAWGVPDYTKTDVNTLAQLQILDAVQKRYPTIRPETTAGLEIPGRTLDMVPLMQIAGDIAPEVMYINFRKSDTYISNKFLYPLDKYIEHLARFRIFTGGQFVATAGIFGSAARRPALSGVNLPIACGTMLGKSCGVPVPMATSVRT